jgi:hypothetical protein
MTTHSGALSGWFKRRPSEADETHPDDPATGSTTQTGGDDSQKPVVVWEAANRMEAEIVAGRLQSEDIPTIIRGEAVGAIYGFTTGTLAAATVLVPAALAEKALAILAAEVEWDDADHPTDQTATDQTATDRDDSPASGTATDSNRGKLDDQHPS